MGDTLHPETEGIDGADFFGIVGPKSMEIHGPTNDSLTYLAYGGYGYYLGLMNALIYEVSTNEPGL